MNEWLGIGDTDISNENVPLRASQSEIEALHSI